MTDQGAPDRNIRVKAFRGAAFAIVIAVSSANLVWMSVGTRPKAIDEAAFPSDPVARHELRYEAVRASLAARRIGGTIGYIGGQPREGWRFDADSKPVQDYYLAQLALAPVILDADREDYEWIVADIAPDQLASRAPLGSKVVEDFGNGTLLLRKETP